MLKYILKLTDKESCLEHTKIKQVLSPLGPKWRNNRMDANIELINNLNHYI